MTWENYELDEGLRKHDPHVQDFIRRQLKEGETFYDIGAHVGIMTRVALDVLKTTGHVYAFEPNPKATARLIDNCGRVENLTILPVACSTFHNQFLNLVYLGSHSGGAMTFDEKHTPNEGSYAGHPFERTVVRTMGVSLDEMIDMNVIKAPNVIKADTQGHEVAWMLGAKRILSNHTLHSMVIEWDDGLLHYHGQEEGHLFDLLKETGWKWSFLEGWGDLFCVRE